MTKTGSPVFYAEPYSFLFKIATSNEPSDTLCFGPICNSCHPSSHSVQELEAYSVGVADPSIAPGTINFGISSRRAQLLLIDDICCRLPSILPACDFILLFTHCYTDGINRLFYLQQSSNENAGVRLSMLFSQIL